MPSDNPYGKLTARLTGNSYPIITARVSGNFYPILTGGILTGNLLTPAITGIARTMPLVESYRTGPYPYDPYPILTPAHTPENLPAGKDFGHKTYLKVFFVSL